MIEYDESEFQECAVSRVTYDLTELCLGTAVADRSLYKPPDEVTQHVETLRHTPDPLGAAG